MIGYRTQPKSRFERSVPWLGIGRFTLASALDSDVYDAGTAETAYSTEIRLFNEDGERHAGEAATDKAEDLLLN